MHTSFRGYLLDRKPNLSCVFVHFTSQSVYNWYAARRWKPTEQKEEEGSVGILPCFQEEIMVQEDPIELEKMMA